MLAAEMEGAAIAQVCHQYETPFIIIRAISDVAGKDSPVTFEQFLQQSAKNAAEMILRLLDS
jgi:5''-methylthioadenosine/S-adenosylhomocysteine nucleosidase